MKLIKEGIFSEGILQNEFFIPVIINLNDDKVKYYERLNWDILNNNLTPENFAEQIIIDENLTYEYINIISLQIRKQIKNFIFELFKNFYENYCKYNQKEFLEQRIKRKGEKNIIGFLFDSKLTDILGNKRKREFNNNKDEINKQLKRNLLKECNSEIIKIDKRLFNKFTRTKNYDDSEQVSISGNEESENNSKTHSASTSHLNTLEKDLTEKVVIQIESKC